PLRAPHVVLSGKAGDDQDRRPGRAVPHDLHHLPPAHVWHRKVSDHKVVPLACQQGQPRAAVLAFVRGIAQAPQQVAHEGADGAVVINEEVPGVGHGSLPRSTSELRKTCKVMPRPSPRRKCCEPCGTWRAVKRERHDAQSRPGLLKILPEEEGQKETRHDAQLRARWVGLSRRDQREGAAPIRFSTLSTNVVRFTGFSTRPTMLRPSTCAHSSPKSTKNP